MFEKEDLLGHNVTHKYIINQRSVLVILKLNPKDPEKILNVREFIVNYTEILISTRRSVIKNGVLHVIIVIIREERREGKKVLRWTKIGTTVSFFR